MKKAKVRVVANYGSSVSYSNIVDRILNLPIDFTESDIVDKISELKYCDYSYYFKTIEVLCVYDE